MSGETLAAALLPPQPGRTRAPLPAPLAAGLLLLVLLLLWEAAIRLGNVPGFVLPAPSAIAQVLVSEQSQLASATWVTAVEVLVGFALSAVAGVALALAIARFDVLARALYPLVVLFQTVPKVALAPLFVLWLGYGLAPKALLIVVIAFFPVALNMLAGLRAVDPNLVALMRSVGSSRGAILWRVQVPTSLPQLMAGLKIAVTLSVIGAIVGEFAGASAGLGYVIEFASSQLETALVFAALVQVSVLGVLFYYAVEWAERLLLRWRPTA